MSSDPPLALALVRLPVLVMDPQLAQVLDRTQSEDLNHGPMTMTDTDINILVTHVAPMKLQLLHTLLRVRRD